MKRLTTILSALFIVVVIMAQSNASRPQSFRIEKVFLPPNLILREGSVVFSDTDGDNNINANEECHISFDVENTGKGDAHNCIVRVFANGSVQGLLFENQKISILKTGQTAHISVPIKTNMSTVDGKARLCIVVDEPNGYGTDTIKRIINTRKFDEPDVRIVQHKVISDDGMLQKKRNFKVQVLLQNLGQGVAKNVQCRLTVPENIYLQDGESVNNYSILSPNQKDTLEFELSASAYAQDNEVLKFAIKEYYGKYAENYSVPLSFGQQTYSGGTEVAIKGREREKVDIVVGSLLSDVDENLPVADKQNDLTFAVIIANETYQNYQNVDYALNDGNVMYEYLTKVLGIPAENIRYERDATRSNIEQWVEWLHKILLAYGKDAKAIFYYAGHGIPDESNRASYLLPVDGVSSNPRTCYKLDDLYTSLGDCNADRIMIFIDACFSGSNRGDGMLASARGVALKAKPGMPVGNMVVFSAAQGDETALPYRDEQHGMFTYFLLKKLKETSGNTNLKQLADYITDNVRRKSIVLNDKSQTPTVSASSAVSSVWEQWTLK